MDTTIVKGKKFTNVHIKDNYENQVCIKCFTLEDYDKTIKEFEDIVNALFYAKQKREELEYGD